MISKEELNNLYWNKGMSCLQIGKLHGVVFQTVHSWMIRYGIDRRPYGTKGLKFSGRSLSKEHREKLRIWHTGRKLSPEQKEKAVKNFIETWNNNRKDEGTIVKYHGAYLRIKLKNGWKYYHRWIVEKSIGRELKREEQVHHINFDSSDNRIENLVVLSRSEHLRLHSQLEYIMKNLMSTGIVYFDGKTYQIAS